jgi:hypothetical protein
MASLSFNIAGLVLILDSQDISTVIAVTKVGGDVASLAKIGLPPWLGPVIVAYFKVQELLIKEMDKGFGIYLTLPWPAIWYNQWWIIIPTTRPEIGLRADWVKSGSGQFRTEDSADNISYEVQLNVVSTDVVEFRLEAATSSKMWRKVLVMPDGQGTQWDIAINPDEGTFVATDGLWAGQVKNGQQLQLWKAKTFGVMSWVLNIGNLQDLLPGSRVVFRWLSD